MQFRRAEWDLCLFGLTADFICFLMQIQHHLIPSSAPLLTTRPVKYGFYYAANTDIANRCFFFSQWEQAGYALWSCNAASSNLFHWSTVGENKPRNENKRLRASNISFFQKIVGYKYFMRRIFFIYVLFKDISDTQCSLVRNCEWLFFFFFTKWSTGHPKILYFHQFVQICFHFFIHLFSPGDCVNTCYLHSVLF